MNVHFTLTAKWHDKAAHGLLRKHYIGIGVSHNQVVSGHARIVSFRILLEDLALAELLNILQNYGLILHERDALFHSFFVNNFCLLPSSHFKSQLRWRTDSSSLHSLSYAEEVRDEF